MVIHILVRFQIKQSTIFSKFTQEAPFWETQRKLNCAKNKTKHFVFMCNAELASRSGHCRQV